MNKQAENGLHWADQLPKIELHCHLDGSIPLWLLRELGEKAGLSLPEKEEELRAMAQAGEEVQSLAEYLKCFELPLKCLQNEDAFYRAAYYIGKEGAGENLNYMELRFAPLLSEGEKLPAPAIIEAAAAGCEAAYRDYGIRMQLLLCGMRHFSLKDNLRTLELASVYLGKGVCGVDLAGDEAAWPNERFSEYFQEAKRREIPMTIHAGECRRAENVRLAIEGGAGRIGHGIAMKGHEELEMLCRERKTGIELCFQSNLQTRAAENGADYPLREFMEKKLLVTVNTDNRTVTGTTLSAELKQMEQAFGLTQQEGILLMKNAAEVCFAPEGVKKELLKAYA